MVHLPDAVKKVKTEPSAEHETEPLLKRFRFSTPPTSQQERGAGTLPMPKHDVTDQSSPLGLRLKKSPSLVDLIQMRLSQVSADGGSAEEYRDCKQSAAGSASEKLKASNFPVSLLRIGDWERVSRYEGDLVAKCYFAKHKLVWEVLDGGLKSKIEIPWSDITALKANCSEDEPGTLEVVLCRPPLFFKETNPQPRKHTLWQATSDFTGNKASTYRQHFLKCPPGLMNRHIEKLLRCDPRLYSLSQQSLVVVDSPFFQQRNSLLREADGCRSQESESSEESYQLQVQEYQNIIDPSRVGPIALINEAGPSQSMQDAGDRIYPFSAEANMSRDALDWRTYGVPGMSRSLSRNEIMDQIGHRIYRQFNLNNQMGSGSVFPSKETLDGLTQYLLSDSQILASADEKSLMSRVNSLCSLLQKDSMPIIHANNHDGDFGEGRAEAHVSGRKPLFDSPDEELKQPLKIPREDSFSNLLARLPRIDSFPQFL